MDEYKLNDWYVDPDTGRIYVFSLDKSTNRSYWQEIDPWITGILEGREVDKPIKEDNT